VIVGEGGLAGDSRTHRLAGRIRAARCRAGAVVIARAFRTGSGAVSRAIGIARAPLTQRGRISCVRCGADFRAAVCVRCGTNLRAAGGFSFDGIARLAGQRSARTFGVPAFVVLAGLSVEENTLAMLQRECDLVSTQAGVLLRTVTGFLPPGEAKPIKERRPTPIMGRTGARIGGAGGSPLRGAALNAAPLHTYFRSASMILEKSSLVLTPLSLYAFTS